MPHATINGNEIHYRDTGGDGFPVVLVHGFTGNTRNWALTVPALREKFRVVSLDHRGHGLSHKPTEIESYQLEFLADDLHGLLQHLGIERCFLVGHSMGGMVAQLLVLDHPGLVAALVLVDTAAGIPQSLRAKERYEERQRLVRIAEEHGMEAVFEEQLKANTDPRVRENPEFVQVWREQFLMTSREAYIGGAHGMASRRSVVPRLKEIGVPTLIVCGENDAPFLEASQVMHDKVPGSELIIIPGAGHTPQIETPTEFNRVLTRFLDRVYATAAA
jgi:2-succinyl-6-hydroxy-2,4-cyclohexadiene-1-carboxylate synthase